MYRLNGRVYRAIGAYSYTCTLSSPICGLTWCEYKLVDIVCHLSIMILANTTQYNQYTDPTLYGWISRYTDPTLYGWIPRYTDPTLYGCISRYTDPTLYGWIPRYTDPTLYGSHVINLMQMFIRMF